MSNLTRSEQHGMCQDVKPFACVVALFADGALVIVRVDCMGLLGLPIYYCSNLLLSMKGGGKGGRESVWDRPGPASATLFAVETSTIKR